MPGGDVPRVKKINVGKFLEKTRWGDGLHALRLPVSRYYWGLHL